MTDVKRIIHQVIVHLGPNRIAEGYYTIDGDTLTMTFDDGSPVLLADGSKVTHEITPETNVKGLAAVLAGQVRRELLNELVPGFSRDLDYPAAGIA